MPSPFHLSIPTSDLERARAFYVELLGCGLGRSATRRMDLNFFGHHIVMHLSPREAGHESPTIDGERDPSPIRHFGVILPIEQWEKIAARLKEAKVKFILGPTVIHKGKVSEQSIMLIDDTCGNAVEFKSIPEGRIFAVEEAEDPGAPSRTPA